MTISSTPPGFFVFTLALRSGKPGHVSTTILTTFTSKYQRGPSRDASIHVYTDGEGVIWLPLLLIQIKPTRQPTLSRYLQILLIIDGVNKPLYYTSL